MKVEIIGVGAACGAGHHGDCSACAREVISVRYLAARMTSTAEVGPPRGSMVSPTSPSRLHEIKSVGRRSRASGPSLSPLGAERGSCPGGGCRRSVEPAPR